MGHVPDWVRGSMAKSPAKPVAKTPTKYGVKSHPIFHSEGTVQKFADGGEAEAMPVDMGSTVEAVKLSDDPLGDFIEKAQAGEAPEKSEAAELAKFGDAFKAARASGAKTFSWKGKSYTTEVAGSPSKKSAPSNKAAGSSPETESQPEAPSFMPPMHNEAEGSYEHMQTSKRVLRSSEPRGNAATKAKLRENLGMK